MPLSELPPSLGSSGQPGAELPLIRVPPPGPMSHAWLKRLSSVDVPWIESRRNLRADAAGLDFTPIVLTEGQGSNLSDIDSNRYVDLAAGFGAALLGHRAMRTTKTLEMQASRLLFGLGDVFPSDAKIGLTERLARLYPQPGAKVILGLSGADAIDAAMKTAILATKKPGVIAFKGAYHGLATGPLSLLGYHTEFREPFEPHTSTHVRFATYPTNSSELDHALSMVEHVLQEQPIGAVFVEPILGRGGIVVPPEGFLKELRALTKKHEALLVCDEIWTGMGRAGSLLTSVSGGVVPDVFCLGKGLGGGMPISACVGSKEVMDAWQWSTDMGGEAIHTATHFGNPVACACAIATLDVVVGQKLYERSQNEGEWLLLELVKLAESTPKTGIKSVRGKGLMIGVEVAGGASRGLALMRDLLSNGYIVLTGGDGSVITLTPPLNIPRPLLAGFIETFGDLASQRPFS